MITYEVKKKPSYISFSALDRILSHAIDGLNLNDHDAHLVITLDISHPVGDAAIIYDTECSEHTIHVLLGTCFFYLDQIQFTKALMHEMVHVKQYLTGDFHYCDKSEQWYWAKRPKSEYKVSYKEFPWEQEAWEKERTLFDSFMEKLQAFVNEPDELYQ